MDFTQKIIHYMYSISLISNFFFTLLPVHAVLKKINIILYLKFYFFPSLYNLTINYVYSKISEFMHL